MRNLPISKRALGVSSAILSLSSLTYFYLSQNSSSPEIQPAQHAAHSDSSLHPPRATASSTQSPIDSQHTHSDHCACHHNTAQSPAPTSPVTTAANPHTQAQNSISLTPELSKKLLSHQQGDAIAIPLPGAKQVSGTVTHTRAENGQTVMIQGTLTAPHKGTFFLQQQSMTGVAGSMVGSIVFEGQDYAYSVLPDTNGNPQLVETSTDSVICRSYGSAIPQNSPVETTTQEIPADHPADTNIPAYQNGIPRYSSLPQATGVIYLDFDGETGPFQSWGQVTSNAANPNMSTASIREVWERVSEDYAPFNLNVTTDLQTYLNAPENSRIRCIITPTTEASPGNGGVAYVGSFNWTGDTPCWIFITTTKSCAEAISHEIGHTLQLLHDGTNTPSSYSSSTGEYYYSHGSGDTKWGPIMGAAYSANISHWCKGEYYDASNTQDDLTIITSNNNNVAFRPDDHGDTFSTASYLEVYPDNSVLSQGIIGASSDFDAFRFTTTAKQNVSFAVAPVAQGPNIDILAEIVNSSGTVIASSNPLSTLNATVSTNQLPAGDYFLRVSGVGYGNPSSTPPTGYTDYGSLGFYKITGSLANAVQPDRFTIAESAANGTSVGTISASGTTYSITSGNTNGAFAINSSTGEITVANSSELDYEALSLATDDPATFELFVDVDGTPSRVVVTLTNVNESPSWNSNPLNYSNALVDGSYSASLTTSASDPDYQDLLTYSKISGPAWLSVASDGSLSGSPGSSDIGLNTFTVQASDGTNSPTQTVLNITVESINDYLHAYWTLDESSGANAADSSGNGHTGTLTNGPLWNTGFSGNALLFDGINDHVNFGTSPSLNGATDFSIVAWINTSSATDQVILQQRGSGSTDGQYKFQVNANGTLSFWIYGGGGSQYQVDTTATVNDGKRHLVCAVRQGTKGYIYIDNTATPAGQAQGGVRNLNNSIPVALGRDIRDNNRNFKGLIDEVKLYTCALSPTHLSPLFSAIPANIAPNFISDPINAENAIAGFAYSGSLSTGMIDPDGDPLTYSKISGPAWLSVASDGTLSGTPISADSGMNAFVVQISDGVSTPDQAALNINVSNLNDFLQARWTFNENSGNTATDSSGNGANGTLSNGPTWTTGKSGSALQFDGVDDSVNFGTQTSLSGLTDFTVSAWIKTTSTTEQVIFQQRGPGSVNGQYQFRVNPSGALNFWLYGDYTYQFNISSTATINDGNWHFVSAVRQGANGYIYIDQNATPAASGSGTPRPLSTSIPSAVGRNIRDNNAPFNGAIDDVRLYTRALNSDQIAYLSNDLGYDGDSDSLNDNWEITHYGSTSSVSTTDDTDGDGFTALQEMLFGMDPTANDSAAPPIEQRVVNDSGTNKIEVKFRRPRTYVDLAATYTLQSSSTLQSASWSNETSLTPTISTEGDNEWLTYLVPFSGSNSQLFYRCQATTTP